MVLSKRRIRTNKLKVTLAAAFLLFMRRTWFMGSALSLSLCLPFAVPALAAVQEAAPIFSDISGHWAEKAILEAAADGFVSGYEDGTFRPERRVSRADFAAMLSTGLGIPPIASDSDSGEANQDSPFVQSLRDAGLVKEGDFAVGSMRQDLKRGEMIKLTVRALDSEAADADSPETAGKRAAVSGLVDSDGAQDEDSLQAEVTRAEAVVVLQRLRRVLGLSK